MKKKRKLYKTIRIDLPDKYKDTLFNGTMFIPATPKNIKKIKDIFWN